MKMPGIAHARIAAITSLAFYLLVIFSCKREYSYEGGEGAVYSFAGAPNACVGAVVLGGYYEGIPVNTTNGIQLMVHVSRTGRYDISTDPVNGIGFSLSGKFTDTGTQVLALPAKGRPGTSGTFQVKIPGDNGCYFSITVAPPQPATYTLEGSPKDCTGANIQGIFVAGQTLTNVNKATVTVEVLSPGAYAISTDSANGFYFADTGFFVNAGKQQLVLQGYGNAHGAGLFYYNVQTSNTVCGFYLPVQNTDPQAVYVLQSGIAGNATVCSPYSVQGVYTVSSPVVSTHTATILIYVTQPGNYTIATNRVNGVTFQYSGTITTIGEQEVILFANGTPEAAGSFPYTAQIVGPAPLGGAACIFDVTAQ